MKHLPLLLLLLFPVLAHGADANISCTVPTQFTDNTPIPAGTVITYKLYGSMQGATKTLVATQTNCTFVRTNLAVGTACYDMTATVAGQESAHSNESCKTVSAPIPNPPTLVTVSITAYMEIQRPNGFGFLAVGTVPLGTPCDPAQRVNDFYVVPADKVTFTGPIKRLAVVAACM